MAKIKPAKTKGTMPNSVYKKGGSTKKKRKVSKKKKY